MTRDEHVVATLSSDGRDLFHSCIATLETTWHAQPDKPNESVLSTVATLWHAASGTPVSARRATEARLSDLNLEGAERLHDMLERRASGVPLAYIVGRQQFMGLELIASEDALIPREETELLGGAALECLRSIADQQGSAMAIDVCTGSGNLAIALACLEPRASVWGADLSEEAVALAQRNSAKLNDTHAGLDSRLRFRAGDFLSPFDSEEFHGRVDLLVCNPPYISSARVDTLPGEIIAHEPRLAFDGGPLGIRILQRLVNEAPRFLRPGGWLAFEVGLGQGRGMKKRLGQHGAYLDIREVIDRDGGVRALLARAKTTQT